ncbi:hypothetical protein BEL05_13970 [Shewanella colwelliana]|uniref:FAD/FMN-containing dehydrogenase n=1 Tax=Shewanella colwelliana TaxID=23 RepID=A0A1E5ITH9_SHECO|nr:hypothetical protein [Shewanella colwelliana]OEG73368.1 hypothetical protein BEL05_13970 [Shewanella colwelliana]
MKALVFVLSLLVFSSAQATTITVGDSLQVVDFKDQHEQSIGVSADTKVLLFSRGMKGGDIIKEALETLPQTEQPAHLVYIADISGMPSLIAKFVAVPQMKDLPFSIGLDREGEQTQLWPGDKETATVIKLEQLKVMSVTQAATASELVDVIK